MFRILQTQNLHSKILAMAVANQLQMEVLLILTAINQLQAHEDLSPPVNSLLRENFSRNLR